MVKTMTGRTAVRRKDQGSLAPGKEKLNRLLIQQFYETSVDRYGSDSEQARMLSRMLSPAAREGSGAIR